MQKSDRKELEFEDHPIRTTGRPTMAWVRIDMCFETGVALIEEIQSDWFRNVRWELEYMARTQPRSREMRNHKRYEAELLKLYGRDWARVSLLAALVLLREEFGCTKVFLHQPIAGSAFKGIEGDHPPRSLYSSLPKFFCFQKTTDVPEFLNRPCKKLISRLRKRSEPLFWQLQFPEIGI